MTGQSGGIQTSFWDEPETVEQSVTETVADTAPETVKQTVEQTVEQTTGEGEKAEPESSGAPVEAFATDIKNDKAPDLWLLTWEQCLLVYSKGGSLISWEGHILAGKDRKMEAKGQQQVYGQYLNTLEKAFKAGKEIPQAVKDNEQELFAKLQSRAA
jgi:hypothetical protein